MVNITLELTDVQNKCMEYCASSAQEWAENAVINRSNIARDEIIAILVAHCNENEIALAVGSDAQVNQAFELGVVQTAAERDAQFLAEEAALASE